MPPTALEFLKLILPVEGLKCAAIFTGKKVSHRFTPSLEELAQIIASADALGHTVYHACASYATPDSRKASNVLAVKAFWADVDYGAEHHAKPSKYADAQEAAEAVLLCCRTANLPYPVFASSGHGLHIYWPLGEALAPEIWRRHAGILKSILDRHGLEVDGSRATDCASILRTPGTHNRKGIEQIVRWGGPAGPYALSDFNGALGGTSLLELRSSSGRPSVLPTANARRPSLIAGALTLYGESPNYAEPIAAQCRQVGELRISRGVLPEPQWYAALGVLAHCVDGDAYAHQWSSGYAGYTSEETGRRLERAREFGPTTCEKFTGVNSAGCKGCPFQGSITSPIQLGRADATSVQQPPTHQPVERFETSSNVVGVSALPKLPGEFRWYGPGQALAFLSENNKEEPLYEIVSTYPIHLTGVQTGEIHDESFSLKFALKLPNEAVKEITIPAKTLFSASGLSEVAGRGAVIHEPDLFKKYVREAVDMFNAEHRLDKQFEQYGWKDDGSFLGGPYLYNAGDCHSVVGSGEVKVRNQWLGPNKGGSLGKWSGAANALFTKGCEPQSFALLGSFAAPLMRFHSSGEGGSIISLVNDQSGSGKTTALEAVESVWGRKEALRLTDDDTRVSKSLILGVLANLPVTWDELYNRDPEVIRQFVLMFTNGRDKMRGTQDGGLRHNKATWQTILTLASNNSIVDILSTGDNSDAPAFRIMEFQTEIPAGIARKGDDLKRILRDNSGFAGHEYMKLLTQPAVCAYIQQALPKWTEQVWQKTKLNNEHRFWVRTIASVIAAGVLVNKLGILECTPDRITSWAMEYVQDRRTGESNRRDPINAFSEFLSQNVVNTLVVATGWKPRTQLRPLVEPRKELHIRYERDSGRIYVSKAHLRKWLVQGGVSIRTFETVMGMQHIMLKDTKAVTLGGGTDYASGQTACYEIDGQHPAISGALREVEKLLPGETRKERVERYQESLKT